MSERRTTRFISGTEVLRRANGERKQMTTLTNARLIDGTGAQPRDGVAVIIKDGLIHEVRDNSEGLDNEGAEIIDLEGRTLLPGLINAHMHIMMDASPDPTTALKRDGLAVALLKAVRH